MLGEDLSIFFNPAEHAVPATFKTPAGALVREANVILSLPVQQMPVGPGEVEHVQPSLQCPSAALEGVRKGYVVEVGGGAYTIVKREADGTGLSTAYLARVNAG